MNVHQLWTRNPDTDHVISLIGLFSTDALARQSMRSFVEFGKQYHSCTIVETTLDTGETINHTKLDWAEQDNCFYVTNPWKSEWNDYFSSLENLISPAKA